MTSSWPAINRSPAPTPVLPRWPLEMTFSSPVSTTPAAFLAIFWRWRSQPPRLIPLTEIYHLIPALTSLVAAIAAGRSHFLSNIFVSFLPFPDQLLVGHYRPPPQTTSPLQGQTFETTLDSSHGRECRRRTLPYPAAISSLFSQSTAGLRRSLPPSPLPRSLLSIETNNASLATIGNF